jgi:hypothetical protein
MALDKLKESGVKPREKSTVESEEFENEVKTILEKVEKSEPKKRVLSLLFEALSESDAREILIYGMYVKKNLAPIVPATSEEKIEKTLEWLGKAIQGVNPR